MTDYLRNFFDTSDFPARWSCGNWSEFLGWLHIFSDTATFAAYFAIPLVLFYFARRRRDFPFIKLFWLFGAFILACGTVHLIEAIIFWYPIYRISGAMKFVTAVVSWGTVIALVRYAPRIMAIPSLAATNQQLRVEIQQRKESQQGLRRLTARYEALLSGTRSIIWTTDAEGQFATDQESWKRFTGQAYGEHRGFGFLAAVHEEDRDDLMRRWQHARDKKKRYRAVYRLWNAKTKSFRRSSSEAMPVLDEDSEVIEWIGTNTDIEDQSAAEFALGMAQGELSKQKEELELIYESAPVGMCLIDRDFRFMRINETLAKINGVARESHLGKRADELLPDLDDQLKPIYERVFTTGQAVLDVEINGTTPASTESRTWLGSYFPLKDHSVSGDKSTVTAVNAIVQDITDRKSTEIRLRESEQAALAANESKSAFLANMSHEIRTPMTAILGYADLIRDRITDEDTLAHLRTIRRNGGYLLDIINDIRVKLECLLMV
jgi:PAS domain S-box-containing protein